MYIFSLLCDLKWYVNLKPKLSMGTSSFPSVKIACLIITRQSDHWRGACSLSFSCPSAMVLFCFDICISEVYRLLLLFNWMTVIILTDFKLSRCLFPPFSVSAFPFFPSHVYFQAHFLSLYYFFKHFTPILQEMGGHAIHNPNVGVKWRQNLPSSKTLLWGWSSGVCGTSPTPQTEISLVFLEEDR